MMNRYKFEQALKDQACDVVDAMLAEGYVPEPDCIKIVCRNGNITLLQTLLHSGKYDMDVQLGLFTAVKYEQTHLLNYLYLAGADVNFLDKYGRNTLNVVRDVETCKWLLDMGAWQVPSRFGETPVFNACLIGNIELLKLLLSTEQGVQSIPFVTNRGSTALSRSCHYKRTNIVKLLLSHESGVQSISMVDRDGNTPLHVACSVGCREIVELLLSYEPGVQSISVANKDGNTPLHVACRLGYKEIIELLLSYDSGVRSISVANKYGKTPLDKAKLYPNILALLQKVI